MRRFLPLVLLIISSVLFVFTFFPAPRMTDHFGVDGAVFLPQPMEGESQWIEFEFSFPRRVRLGEKASITLKINLDERNTGEVQAWQARLQMSGVSISPDGDSRQRAIAGKETLFRWYIEPYKLNAGKGTLWLYGIRKDNPAKDNAELILSHPFEVKVWGWIGALSWNFLRVVAAAGVVIALLWWGWGNRLKSAHKNNMPAKTYG